ncbi:MAG TPA: UDP-3-O-[3-hydroxymyristoyl] N-acetylglucosamine deacetylase [Planctomycetaceae bacterium]|nr:UDP-3-O-[3-hydroxymyristoyl] N-acetylglucosamine deacetylase [Planctomycetaceae bacterium]
MHRTRNQRTIRETVAVEGFGYWSGRDIRVEFRPAEANTGIVFVRGDLPDRPRIPARVAHRTDMPLRSNLQYGGARVEMIEHIMATFSGMQIDNCEVWVDEEEMPGCDGSCLAFVEALQSTEIVSQDAPRRRLAIHETVRASRGDAWIELRPGDGDGLVLDYRLDFGPGPIGRQQLSLTMTPETFLRELAPCRTFLMQAEADQLRAHGLGRRVGFSDLLVFGHDGPIDNSLRFDDECVRHKVLDLIGDLALADCDLAGSAVAARSGHYLNAKVLQALLTQSESNGRFRRCA